MYQREVRPRFGHEYAAQSASEQQGSSVIRRHLPSTALFLLLSFYTNRLLRRSALAVLAGCLVALLSGCGGVTFNSSSSQRGSGTTAAAATLTMISCGVQSLTGGQTKACSVYLSGSAASSTTVSLTSNNAALKLPTSVVVATGQKTAEFNAVTQAVAKPVTVTITGEAQGVTETDVVTLNPVADSPTSPLAALSNISCATQSLTGPTTIACSVSLSGAASSQKVVTLSSSSSALRAPASVTVPKDETSASFSVTAAAVSTSQKATLTATTGGESKSDVIMLYPAAPTTPAPVASLKGLSCGTDSITGAQTEVCSVSLSAATTSQTVVKLSSNSSALRAPASVTVPKDEISATFSVTAKAVSASQKATLTATADGASKTDVITLYPAQTATATLSKISCGTQSLTGAQTKSCSVTLSEAATSQMVVNLSSSSSALNTPPSVAVPKGATSATFSVTATAVNASQKATLTATADGVSQIDVLTLYPGQAAVPTLSKISCGTQTLTGPTTETCVVYLTTAATTKTVVTLSSSNSALKVPASLSLAAGATSTGFSVTASAVSTPQLATLTATSNGVSQSDVIQLEGAGAQPATQHTVQLTWLPPPSSTAVVVTGYRVYRAISGSSYQLLNSTLDAETSYADSTVQSGQTYDYVVKTVDSAGIESAPSNETTVVIP